MESEKGPKCPHCGAINSFGRLFDVWVVMNCVNCGRSFQAKAVKQFETVTM